jgi:hypothetical protein
VRRLTGCDLWTVPAGQGFNMSNTDRFAAAIAAIDAANAKDPNRVPHNGIDYPEELLYAERMTEWLNRLAPGASEPVRLAARAQHLQRWEIPRASYPMDRIGYLKWRTTLYQFHADRAGEILRSVGYDEATVARVASLLKKEKLKVDPDSQLLEDVICLVFLQYEFADFLPQHPDETKIVNILQKTWKKMSPRGHAAALAMAPSLPSEAQRIIQKALSVPPASS